MLRLNTSPDASSFAQDVWKVLIYDQFCRDLISPLMNVKDLRAEGVTLHMYAIVYFIALSCYAVEKWQSDARNPSILGLFTQTIASRSQRCPPSTLCNPTKITSSVFAVYVSFDGLLGSVRPVGGIVFGSSFSNALFGFILVFVALGYWFRHV